MINQGFNVNQEVIVQMADAMDTSSASICRVSLTNSEKINGKDLHLIMVDYKHCTRFQKLIIYIFKRWL